MSFTDQEINEACERNGWVRTGVFATPAEIEQAKRWKQEQDDTPCVKVHGHWLPDDAEELFQVRIDSLARKHGLPELAPIDGKPDHYGFIVTGEFTTLKR